MKIFRLVTILTILFTYITTATYGAYSVVPCSSDSEFGANSCNECFSGGEVAVGDNKGLLTDVWKNNSDSLQVLFKEEQDMPKILGLNGASWKEIKASDNVDFWQYTSALDALYEEDQFGYTLASGESVTWLESTLGSAYNLEKSDVAQGDNVGILLYDVAVHQVDDAGNPETDASNYRECVLFTSGDSEVLEVPKTPELPETGADQVFLAIAALILGFGILRFRKKA